MDDPHRAARDAVLEGLGLLAEQIAQAQTAVEQQQPDLTVLDRALGVMATEVLACARLAEHLRIESSEAVREAQAILESLGPDQADESGDAP